MSGQRAPKGRGLHFEDFVVGQRYETAARTIGEEDVMAFARLTGDESPIHIDAGYAARHPLGQRVAHGLLGLSVAVAQAVRLGFLEGTLIAFRGIREWKFSRPIYFGDSLRARMEVVEVRPAPPLGGGMVTLRVEVVNQRDEMVQQGEWSVVVMGRNKE